MKTFEQIKNEITIYTAVDDNRLRVIHEKVKETSNLLGPMCEVGVYKGGSAYMIASSDPKRIVYLCDSFQGLPESTEEDKNNVNIHKKGDFSDTSAYNVRQFLKPLKNKQVFEGFFPDPEIHRKLYTKQFSFVHIDVDLYQSTLECIKFFWPRMEDDGIIVFDDFDWPHTPGVKKAIKVYFDLDVIQDTGYNQCWIRK